MTIFSIGDKVTRHKFHLDGEFKDGQEYTVSEISENGWIKLSDLGGTYLKSFWCNQYFDLVKTAKKSIDIMQVKNLSIEQLMELEELIQDEYLMRCKAVV